MNTTETTPPGTLQRRVRRLALAWHVRLPKLACRRIRIYGAICRMNGRLRAGLSDTQLRWWHRNSGRLLKLDAKWFHRAETSKPPNAPSSATPPL